MLHAFFIFLGLGEGKQPCMPTHNFFRAVKENM